MQEITFNDLSGEWMCIQDDKPFLYFRFHSDGRYSMFDHSKQSDRKGTLNLKLSDRNTILLSHDGIATYELWHILNDNEIVIKIDDIPFNFKKI